MNDDLLTLEDLHVSFHTYAGKVHAVRGVSFSLSPGETIAIVGESGCGKSVTAQAIMGLIPSPPGTIEKGSIVFENQDLLKLSPRAMEHVRGREIGMIFQDPMTSLNPTMRVGKQIMEGLRKHQNLKRDAAKLRAIEMLELVGIPQPDKRAEQYPHQFSGGMRQRAMIAIALACHPKLLIADEPTTALDVTIQAQILDLMQEIQHQMGTSIIMITHDLGVVAAMAERILVMYAGKVVESGSADQIFYNPQHPYTKGLLRSVPRLHSNKAEHLIPIVGSPPDLHQAPTGCSFCPRCRYAMRLCAEQDPPWFPVEFGHGTACWLHHDFAKERRHKFEKDQPILRRQTSS